MAKKGQKFSKYSAEYKLLIVIDKLENKLTYSAVAKKYWNPETKQLGSYVNTIKRWEHEYQKNGLAGLRKEHRGRLAKAKTTPPEKNPEQKPTEQKPAQQLKIPFEAIY